MNKEGPFSTVLTIWMGGTNNKEIKWNFHFLKCVMKKTNQRIMVGKSMACAGRRGLL